jgi:hypothetical protein
MRVGALRGSWLYKIFRNIWIYFFKSISGFSDKDLDDIRGLFTEVNMYLLALTFAISIFHVRIYSIIVWYIENNTWACRDMKFIFECSSLKSHEWAQRTIEISSLNTRRYISPSEDTYLHVLFCLLYKHLTQIQKKKMVEIAD